MTSFVIGESAPRGIATISLNRPDKANSYDAAMLQEIAAHFERFGADQEVRAIVLRGAGRHFSAGADVAGAEPQPGGRGIHEVCSLIEASPKPTIALVRGACVGGGMALACACDILIAARGAFFSVPEVRLGFTPGPLSLFFARALGLRAFRRYALTGQRFSAEECSRIGLVHELCEDETLDQGLAAQIEEILLAAPNAARGAKAIAARLEAWSGNAALVAELQAQFLELRHSAEAEEGQASFRGKRKPAWYPDKKTTGETR